MSKTCINCGVQIPHKRVELGFKDCVECSSVETYGFVNIINHKTGNTVQPMPKTQADAINKIGERKRFGTVLRGGSKTNTYNPKRTKHGVSNNFIGTKQLFDKVGTEAMYLLEYQGISSALLYIEKQTKEYVINASQAFQLRQILQVINN